VCSSRDSGRLLGFHLGTLVYPLSRPEETRIFEPPGQAAERAAQRCLGRRPGAHRGRWCPRAPTVGPLHDPRVVVPAQDRVPGRGGGWSYIGL